MRSPARQYRHLKRYREIARVLIRHGFGGLVDQLGLMPALSLPRRLLHREAEAPPLSPPEHFRLVIEELGPTFIKLGQILSTRPDLVPPAYIRGLIRLQDTLPPAPWEAVKAQIETELGGPVEDIFASFEVEPLAVASLSQVHGATLPDGREVVVKVQRPDIEKVIAVDLEILFDLARLVQERTPLGEIYDLPEIAEDFAYTLRAEMDYRREGRNADRFRRKVYWNYTTGRVLVLERIRGIKIDDVEALDAAGVDRPGGPQRCSHRRQRGAR
jgi:ubiquinone biosynthesis protein